MRKEGHHLLHSERELAEQTLNILRNFSIDPKSQEMIDDFLDNFGEKVIGKITGYDGHWVEKSKSASHQTHSKTGQEILGLVLEEFQEKFYFEEKISTNKDIVLSFLNSFRNKILEYRNVGKNLDDRSNSVEFTFWSMGFPNVRNSIRKMIKEPSVQKEMEHILDSLLINRVNELVDLVLLSNNNLGSLGYIFTILSNKEVYNRKGSEFVEFFEKIDSIRTRERDSLLGISINKVFLGIGSSLKIVKSEKSRLKVELDDLFKDAPQYVKLAIEKQWSDLNL